MQKVKEQLKRHEGLELKPYMCTSGKLTIGYGRNLEDKGISEKEADSMLTEDIIDVYESLNQFEWFAVLDKARAGVLVNMTFNIGFNGIQKFIKMINALSLKDYELAAKEMLDSRWARQVGGRATELAEQMRTGEWQ